jgi:transaldolase
MQATRVLYDLGQSLWLDNITRDLLVSGTLKKYIESLSVTGLTSNPTIFDHAISRSTPMTRKSVGWSGVAFRARRCSSSSQYRISRRRQTCLPNS